MKRIFPFILSVIVLFGVLDAIQAHLTQRIYDLQNNKEMLMSNAISDLKRNRIILVGEHHTNQSHHLAQLNVIQSLKEAGVQVAVGLEMFRSDSQPALDSWIAGKMDAAEFKKIYFDNWNYPWADYGMILDYAREAKIPLIGLNVPMEIPRQVAHQAAYKYSMPGIHSCIYKREAK